MRAFLSHSSADKDTVIAVHDGLERESTWLDRAEIEWGDLFLERIAEGIESAADFVLFWSASAAKSEWVRIEVNMAFIQLLRTKAIRLRVVLLDMTPLPLYLRPFHVFSVAASADAAAAILEKLAPLLREPIRSARSRFVNRHEEIGRLEAAVDTPEFRAVWVFGFTGVGKTSLVEEALKRTFEGAEALHVDVTQGTGFVELALELSAGARRESLPIGLSQDQLEFQIRYSIEVLAKEGRILFLSNVQHWLDEDGRPDGPLPFILALIRNMTPFEKRPLFLTSTRRPTLDATTATRLTTFQLRGLADEHIATLVRNWYFLIHGRDLNVDDAKRIAPKLYGHPVAARLVAGLLGNQTVDFLERYPQEIVSLRRDLARVLLRDLNLSPSAERLMETLALAGVALPASVIVNTGITDEEFQQAVAQCADAGLITADLAIETHPLFRDFFWHHLHRGDYRELALRLAEATKAHLDAADRTSLEFASLLLVAFRSYGLAGNLAKARGLRRDLSGELEATAITLYNRRNYSLADEYIQHLLDENPKNWRMRLYRARIRVREERWDEADRILQEMIRERPGDIGVLHATGWSQLKQRHLQEALDIFTGIISRRDHVASLRDAAECLYRLGNTREALKLLERAKEQESENAFVLDLESQILESLREFEAAYESALLASARDPSNWQMHNRLGVIRNRQKRPHEAIPHFRKAIELDQDQFSPANSLASAYLDCGDLKAAVALFPELKTKARTPSNLALLRHTEARIALANKELDTSREILKRDIAQQHNVVPNHGLLVRVELETFDQNISDFPTIAAAALKAAQAGLDRIVSLDPSNESIQVLQNEIQIRRSAPVPSKSKGSTGASRPGLPTKPAPSVRQDTAATAQAGPGRARTPTPTAPTQSAKKAPLKPPLSPPSRPPAK
jgi:tetratricopeptide (TPR) repeat protein